MINWSFTEKTIIKACSVMHKMRDASSNFTSSDFNIDECKLLNAYLFKEFIHNNAVLLQKRNILSSGSKYAPKKPETSMQSKSLIFSLNGMEGIENDKLIKDGSLPIIATVENEDDSSEESLNEQENAEKLAMKFDEWLCMRTICTIIQNIIMTKFNRRHPPRCER